MTTAIGVVMTEHIVPAGSRISTRRQAAALSQATRKRSGALGCDSCERTGRDSRRADRMH